MRAAAELLQVGAPVAVRIRKRPILVRCRRRVQPEGGLPAVREPVVVGVERRQRSGGRHTEDESASRHAIVRHAIKQAVRARDERRGRSPFGIAERVEACELARRRIEADQRRRQRTDEPVERAVRRRGQIVDALAHRKRVDRLGRASRRLNRQDLLTRTAERAKRDVEHAAGAHRLADIRAGQRGERLMAVRVRIDAEDRGVTADDEAYEGQIEPRPVEPSVAGQLELRDDRQAGGQRQIRDDTSSVGQRVEPIDPGNQRSPAECRISRPFGARTSPPSVNGP